MMVTCKNCEQHYQVAEPTDTCPVCLKPIQTVLMPLEPTEAMINAANDSMWEAEGPLNPNGCEYALWVQVYRAMIGARP